jgi:hypothetical protein
MGTLGDLETILVVTCNMGDLFLTQETALSRQLKLPVDEPLFEDELPDGVLLMMETNPDSIVCTLADLVASDNVLFVIVE